MRPRARAALVGAAALALGAPAAGQIPATGRDAVEALVFEPLRFEAPEPDVREVDGVRVFHILDRALPLVDVFARFDGGYARFGRENYAAGTALPGLLRSGGTETLPPDTVDVRLESLALQTSFGGAGGAVSASLNTLLTTLDPALELWWEMVSRPGFDTAAVAVWRERQLESILRRTDDPGRLAFSEFNRLMYGDHPIGWEMTADDLGPDQVSPERFHDLHRRIVCRENLVLGVAGDVTWSEMEPRIRAMVRALPSCPGPVPASPDPDIRRAGGVFVIPRKLDQSTVVLAHSTSLRQGADPAFFASRIGNAILGASGFSSRLLARLRTEEGYAYSAASLWTTPQEYDGLLGATTRTRSGTTVAALRTILEIFQGMGEAPPAPAEVADAVDEFVNGFVFAFESPASVVVRRMSYEAADLPPDWLARYVEGIQEVDPESVRRVFADQMEPSRWTVLVVGDPDAFDGSLESLGLGPVTILDPEGLPSGPSGSPRSRK